MSDSVVFALNDHCRFKAGSKLAQFQLNKNYGYGSCREPHNVVMR